MQNFIFGSIFCIVGLGLFFFGFKRLALVRRIQTMATSKNRSVAMGFVEVFGLAKSQYKLLDPIYNNPCVYYSVKVEERRSSGKNSHWVTIYQDNSAGFSFAVEDASGLVEVFPKDAELQLSSKITCTSSFGFGSSPEDLFLKKWKGLNTVQLTAYIIRLGDPVFIIGHVGLNNKQMVYPITIADAARDLKSDAQAMKKADGNQDGTIDSSEWDHAIQEKKKEMEFNQNKKNISDPQIPAIRKEKSEPFIIGNNQEDVVKKLYWSAIIMMIVGPIFFISGFMVLVVKTGKVATQIYFG
ncbi:MAG: hypothetical protein ACKVQC_04210 [Elusimicrobiota bacterium]